MSGRWYEADYASATCDCAAHRGREIRIWPGLKHFDAIVADQTALHNAAVGAARMPFAFTANAGVVLADRAES